MTSSVSTTANPDHPLLAVPFAPIKSCLGLNPNVVSIVPFAILMKSIEREGGTSSGFVVSVPTCNLGTHDDIYVKLNGSLLAQQSVSTFVSWTQWQISVDRGGTFSVQFGSNPAITGIIAGWTTAAMANWRFAVAARCGASYELPELGEPFVITTVPRPVSLTVANEQAQIAGARLAREGRRVLIDGIVVKWQ